MDRTRDSSGRSVRPGVASAAAGLLVAAALCACAPAGGGAEDPLCEEIRKLAGPAREEVRAIARLLAIRPAMAIDFSAASGEYCLNPGSHVMTHFSVRPAETSEDLITFIDAAPLVAKGLRLEEFPPLPPERGKMQAGTWYRYEGGGTEPHHGQPMAGRTWLMLAVDVK